MRLTDPRIRRLLSLAVSIVAATAALAGDPDGDADGVPDMTDNCPAVANAGQSDADADGLGDACDPCVAGPTPDPADPTLVRLFEGALDADPIVESGALLFPSLVEQGVRQLYVVEPAGSVRRKLNGPLVFGGDVLEFRVLSNGTVLYSADSEINEEPRLHRVPLDGGSVVPFGPTLERPEGEFEVGLNESRVVTRYDPAFDLNGNVVCDPEDVLAGSETWWERPVLSSDGRYLYGQTIPFEGANGTMDWDLYVFDLADGTVVNRGKAEPAQGQPPEAFDRLVYRTGRAFSSQSFRAYSIPHVGPEAPVELTFQLEDPGVFIARYSGVSPFGIFALDVSGTGTSAYVRRDLDGSATSTLFGPTSFGGQVGQPSLSADEERFYFVDSRGSTPGVYTVPVDGGSVELLIPGFMNGLPNYEYRQVGDRIFLRARKVNPPQRLLLSRASDGSDLATELTGFGPDDGSVDRYALSPDRLTTFFDGVVTAPFTVKRLYAAPSDGSGPAADLTAGLPLAQDARGAIWSDGFQYDRDSSTVLFFHESTSTVYFPGEFESADRTDLFRRSLSGGTAERLVPPDPQSSIGLSRLGGEHVVARLDDDSLIAFPVSGGPSVPVTGAGQTVTGDGAADWWLWLGSAGAYAFRTHDGLWLRRVADGQDSDADGNPDVCDPCPELSGGADVDGDGIPDACDPCPGNVDTDGDRRCDGADNCPTVANPDQFDRDADGDGDACDCAPLDPTAGRPAPIPDVVLGPASTASWPPLPGADTYEAIAGSLATLDVDGGDCAASGLTTASYGWSDTPAPGSGNWILFRGVDAGCGGAGSFGTDSRGVERTVADCP